MFENYYEKCVENRKSGNHELALQYYQLAKNNFDYYCLNREKLDYEMTILHYYCFKNMKTEGSKFLINYLNNYSLNSQNVWSNLKFYVITLKNLSEEVKVMNLKTIDISNQFVNSTPCKLITKSGQEILNVRYVNYKCRNLPENLKNNWACHINNTALSINNPVNTLNYYNGEKLLIEKNHHESIKKLVDKWTLGLEDIRLFERNNQIKFLATTIEYAEHDKIRIATGNYDINEGQISIEKIFDSPDNEKCEKNWVMLNEDEMIYKWFPLRIYDYENLKFQRSYATPKIFNYFRGSTNIIEISDFKYCLIHTVHYEYPRKYIHWIVKLNEKGQPLAYSVPFDFEGEKVEYCLSMNYLENGNLEFHYSTWDSSSKSLEIPFEYFNDKFIEIEA